MMTPFFQTDRGVLYQGHVLDILRQMESESVHCEITSPPYWGLRDYNLDPVIWDDPGNCEHNFIVSIEPSGTGDGNSFRRDRKAGRKRGGHQPGFCSKCGAWKGCLGLEPDPWLFIKHIVEIFQEVKRVLFDGWFILIMMMDPAKMSSRSMNARGADGEYKMECICQIECDPDGDCVSMLRQKIMKAKKDHKCDECGKYILKGEKYHLDVYVYEGDFYNHRLCMSCFDIRTVLFCTYIFGNLLEDLQIEIQEYGIPEHCIAKLSVEARNKVCEMIEETWDK